MSYIPASDALKGIKVLDLTGDYRVFPNPSNGFFTITFSTNTSEKVKIIITDMLGQVVFESTDDLARGFNEKQIDLSENALGVYQLRLITKEHIFVHPVIIR